MHDWGVLEADHYRKWTIPMVEIFETVEGEGTAAGYPTVFVRVFHCNLRCSWCDTPYSYAPARPEFEATIEEIVDRVNQYSSQRICLTGGEPLMHQEKSAALLLALADRDEVTDVHVETNGAIDLGPFHRLRQKQDHLREKIRFIMDYKLPASGEEHRMIHENFRFLTDRDEVKFVIGDQEDFQCAVRTLETFYQKGQILFSPVFETLSPSLLVKWMLETPLPQVRLNLQLHKWIWDPEKRGV
ncbi:radical SAM protein [Melghirimyces algeriensis]|nr:radical SAM protein [Melghirimyces algeriensis]